MPQITINGVVDDLKIKNFLNKETNYNNHKIIHYFDGFKTISQFFDKNDNIFLQRSFVLPESDIFTDFINEELFNAYERNSLIGESFDLDNKKNIFINFRNIRHFFISSNEKNAKFRYLSSIALKKSIKFSSYNILENPSSEKINNLISECEKNNLFLYFIDRSDFYKAPVIESILVDKDAFVLKNNYFVNSAFGCGETFEDACLLSACNLLFRNPESSRIVPLSSCLDIIYQKKSHKNMFAEYNYNVFLKDSKRIIHFKDNEKYYIFFQKDIIQNTINDVNSYENYLRNLSYSELCKITSDNIFLGALNKKIKNNLNAEVFREYLSVIKVIKEKNSQDINIFMQDVIDGNVPFVYSHNRGDFYLPFIAAAYYYLSAIWSNIDSKIIEDRIRDNFSDKKMIDILLEIICNKRDIFNNPYIFKE